MRRQWRKVSAIVVAIATVFSGMQYVGPSTEVQAKTASDFTTSLFGDHVYVFDDNDSDADIQAVVDRVYGIQETNQFGQDRYALLFKPGRYDNVRAKVGFYTQIAGLGNLPTDTVVNELDCNADWMGANATCNFWRSCENFTVNQTTTWAAAQATSLRRMYFKNWLALDQWGQGWASGGFVADTKVDGTAAAWSEQQYCSRNDYYNAWAGGVWNAVFIGMDPNSKDQDTGGKLESNWQYNPTYQFYTGVEKTPIIRETPYVTVDNNDNYSVFVPDLKANSSGTSWKNGKESGKSISIDKFYIAKPEKDNADTINQALESGKHLILTPGIYRVNKPIKVTRKDTVVLGLGYATLTPTGNNACMEVADVDGVSVSGLLYDAGGSYTETLLKVGPDNATARHQSDPILLSDLFFRVGGVTSSVAQSKTCIIVNANDVIGDNFWVWRADHGAGVAWNSNKTQNGIVVNGNYMTMYGLFVEHFHEYQTLWNGEGGRCYFYQSEMPYDVPNQQSWKSHNGTVDGYASYKVADNVKSHEAYGLGIYSYHRDATINAENAMEVPNAENVAVHNVCTVMLAGNPGISHVINGQGGAVTISGQRQQVVNYGQGHVIIPGGPIETTTPEPTTKEPETQTEQPTRPDAEQGFVITSPAKGEVKAAGDIKIQWNASKLKPVKDYAIYIDGQKVATTTDTSYEYHASKVKYYAVTVQAEYTDGSSRNTPASRFGITKKGLGLSANMGQNLDLKSMNIGWYYNWSENPNTGSKYNDLEFVPMIWKETSANNAKTRINNLKNKGYKYCLTFNEPDVTDQINMTVDQVYSAWQGFDDVTGIKISSPVTALWPSGSPDWFQAFMRKIDTNNDHDTDFIAIHCYPDNYAGSGMADWFLTEIVDWTWNTYHKPIWITEFSTKGQYVTATGGNGTKEFWEAVMPELDKREYVERYAAFDFDNDNTGLWRYANGNLTPAGVVYKEKGNPVDDGKTYYIPEKDVETPVTTVAPTTQKQEVTTKAPVTTKVQETTGRTPIAGEKNIATGKKAYASTELGGNKANLAVDGNNGSRWESEFADNQYIYIDLGSVSRIDQVNINWERAAGKNYTIEVSNNAQNWNTVATVTDGHEGVVATPFNAVDARYVRVNGKTRTTQYGFSIFEMEILGVEGTAVETTKAPETTTKVQVQKPSTPAGLTYTGNDNAPYFFSWGAVNNATSYNFYIDNVLVATGITALTYNAEGQKDKFTPGTHTISVTAVNEAGESGKANYSYVVKEATTQPIIGEKKNLAAGKKAYASTELGGNKANLAVDNNNGSRWESEFTDNQYFYVDLGKTYQFDQVNINWETAAGKNYTIDVSNDAQNWTTVKTITNGKAGLSEITFATTKARYVRMNGKTRTTQYGFSIWEFQVMGTDVPVETEAPTLPPSAASASASSIEGGYNANNAFDGNNGTRWASQWSDDQWLLRDMGQTKSISRVELVWEAAYGKSYEIQVSTDGNTYRTVATVTNGDGGTDVVTFNTVNARFVKFVGKQRGTGYGYSLWEMNIN